MLLDSPVLSGFVDEAQQRVADAVGAGEDVPETAFGFRGGAPLLVVSAYGGRPPRRLLGGVGPVARADTVLYVADARMDLDGGTTDALLAVALPFPEATSAELEVRPYERSGDTCSWAAPVRFGPESAVFGALVEDLTATWTLTGDTDRIAVLQRFHEDDAQVEMAPELDDEIVAILERGSASPTADAERPRRRWGGRRGRR